jgi:two-component system, OmpR family, phosphate regulon sensor histidine kinase PhoR
MGLIVVQSYLLSNAYSIKEQAFERTVESALLSAALRMQAGETLTQVLRINSQHADRRTQLLVTQTFDDDTAVVGSGAKPAFPSHRRFTDTVCIRDSGFSYVTISALKGMVGGGRADSTGALPDTVDEERTVNATGTSITWPDSARALFVSTVLENLRARDRRPLTQRIDRPRLDSVLHQSMHEAGVELDFGWGVVARVADRTHLDSVQFAQPPDALEALQASTLRTPLFPFDPTVRAEQLVVAFPGRNLYVLRQIWPALASSAIFVVLLTLSFLYTIRTILRQQRLATHMVDFVNTMTHEFKTPLSTVTLATEAICRPDVVGRKTKVLQYSRMIADEAARMKLHADRILQLAQLETGELELKCSPLAMHELIRTTTDAFAVQVEARGGTLAIDLRADADCINGDGVHLANVLRNILDNANKYSPDTPHIRLSSERTQSWFVIRIADAGIGVAPEYHERVFDKFYRVPKGNLHDVKGFGIGLSYVKLIMHAHGGSAVLESTPGVGTTVTLSLPLLSPHCPGASPVHP